MKCNFKYFIYITYFWIILFVLVPMLFIIISSFLSQDETNLVNFPFTIKNYIILLQFPFFKIFFRSIIIAVLNTIFCLLFAYPLSFIIIKNRYKSTLLLILMIPFWTNSLIRTYALIAILKSHGIINSILIYYNIINRPIPFLYSNFSVFLGLIYNLFPFMVLPIFSSMEKFNFSLFEIAKDLGANNTYIFCRIFFPNTINGIFIGCCFVFFPTMTLFYIPNILGGSRSILLGNLIQNQFLTSINWPQGSSTNIILIIFLFLLLILLKKFKNI